ncbi:MAG: hypothetical protein A3G25_19975 [Betaproteobacteria bacterium RIFCSPLOWO2_12_FULL_63_13]|nr:MAG: hypothetical protein A3H32_15820 [Betaproteobacteria bacterium RIFCSPLOWO2_02_FULL_63_19]OGA45021.1 MAG: hypothetical protein A3G25_19975 [Betaproteobacteria bacterium RIFCSPLOWO2_12_FULL_63_13]
MEFESRTIRVDGADTHYLEGGNLDGETIVLIHDGGFGADGWMTWKPIMPLLAARHRLFAPDLLGFGGTQKIYDFGEGARSQKINHIARWMNALDIRNAHFIGNSLGGSLILFAAMRSDWPIHKGVSISGTGGPFMRPDPYAPLRDYAPGRDAMRRIVELMVSRRDAEMDELVEARYQRSLIRGHWENLSAPRLRPPGQKSARDAGDAKFFENLGRIRAPMLFVAGGADELLDPGWESQFTSRIAGAKSVVIDGARHQPQYDAAEKLSDAIESFLHGDN